MSSGSEQAAPGQVGRGCRRGNAAAGVPPHQRHPQPWATLPAQARFGVQRGGAEAPGAKGSARHPPETKISRQEGSRVAEYTVLGRERRRRRCRRPSGSPGGRGRRFAKARRVAPLGPTVSRFRLARAKQIGAKPSPTPPAEGGTQAGHATGPFCGRGHVQAALTGCAPPGKEQGAGLGLCLRQKLRTFSPDLMRNLVISSAPLYCKAP